MIISDKMPKNLSKFSVAMQREYPFIKLASALDPYVVLCSLCNGKFNIGARGKSCISDHVKSAKHISGARQVQGNQSLDKFAVDKQDPDEKLLKAKELAFAYHSGKHLWRCN